jgi:hypothetical protein
MKNTITILAIFNGFYAQSHSVIGKWKTIDDETGKTKSVVEIYSVLVNLWQNCRYVDAEKSLCTACSGEEKQTSNGTRYYQRTQKTVKVQRWKNFRSNNRKTIQMFSST